MQTWQTLDDGKKWAFQLDGIITRTGMHGPFHTLSPWNWLLRVSGKARLEGI